VAGLSEILVAGAENLMLGNSVFLIFMSLPKVKYLPHSHVNQSTTTKISFPITIFAFKVVKTSTI
tara:strand:- start:274 stop:468 length:195 start_codon:yes stop_codon:yes gene_type:complete